MKNTKFIFLPRESSAVSLNDSDLELKNDVKQKTGNALYVDDGRVKVLGFDPIALFSTCRLTSSSEKEIKFIENAHIACLLYKLIKL